MVDVLKKKAAEQSFWNKSIQLEIREEEPIRMLCSVIFRRVEILLQLNFSDSLANSYI